MPAKKRKTFRKQEHLAGGISVNFACLRSVTKKRAEVCEELPTTQKKLAKARNMLFRKLAKLRKDAA